MPAVVYAIVPLGEIIFVRDNLKSKGVVCAGALGHCVFDLASFKASVIWLPVKNKVLFM